MTGATVSNWTAFSRRHDDAYRSRPEDATATYPLDLTGLAPQPKQGVHVKLTVPVPGTKDAVAAVLATVPLGTPVTIR